MLRFPTPVPHLLVAWLAAAGSLGTLANQACAQQKQVPLFYDARRLPDMEVERRNQEVQIEQQRLVEERRLEAAANAKRKSDDERRLASETAEAQRKADEEKRVAAEAEAKKKGEEARLAAAEVQRKADEEKRVTAEAEAKKKADEARLAAAEAQRKADDEKRVAAEAEAKKKGEEARLAAAEVQRKADEEKRVTAEAEAKKKADEARLAAAEAQRKADDEKRVAAEAEAKKKGEEARLAALSAAASEAKRKAEDERNRALAETDAKTRADEARTAAATSAAAAVTVAQGNLPRTAALLGPQTTNALKSPPGAAVGPCETPSIKAAARTGGRVEIVVDSPCRRAQPVMIQYGGYDFVRKLNGNGQATINLDLFAGGAEPAKISFADGSSQNITANVADLAEVSKVAIIWQAPVELALHANEAGGTPDKGVWSGAASSAEAAKSIIVKTGLGAGFMSTVNTGITEGPHVEVYTFVHSPEQDVGAVAMSLDYASRGANPSGDTCGQGANAEIPFDVVILDRKGHVQRESGLIPAVKCGEAIPEKARFLRGAVPDLRFRR